ncbi:hypothetical protein Hsar01_02610 [Haloferula sargassicola]|uniref:SbsA Ig-like domain-containing protein n=2 Tax=Haloferula sargassicola TaxID=490096 RepID=A0ABP9UVL4_9BACT
MNGAGSYSENFDTLPIAEASNTWTDDTTLNAWYSNRVVILADTGSTTSGGLRGYGALDSTERALGSLGSGSANPVIYGVLLYNSGSVPVEISSITYTGEQWRVGGTNAVDNTLSVDYQVYDTDPSAGLDLSLGSWSAIPTANFSSITDNGTAGELDGNAPENQLAVDSGSIQIVVPAGQYVVVRWSDPDNSSSDNGLAVDDLNIQWVESTGVDVLPPELVSTTPADDSVTVPVETVEAGDTLVALFNENIQVGTGIINIREVDGDAIVDSIDVTDDFNFFAFDNEADITLGTSLEQGKAYYVEIPSGAILDLEGNAFAGTTATDWNFEVPAPAGPPSVVVNKILNGAPDTVELLVIADGTPGTELDMRGMILKDFSGSGDNGGRYLFTDDALFSDLTAGTLITVVSGSSVSSDTDDSDFTLTLGLEDPVYFTHLAGGFDIANTDMVMIKAAGSDEAGVLGGIHALVAGSHPLAADFTGAKLTSEFGGSNSIIYANNSTSTLDDYNGSDTSLVPSTELSFGAPNNGENAIYIASLRGTNPADGDGAAFVVNTTDTSMFNSLQMFDDGQTGQSATVFINATISSVTLSDVTVEVPSVLGTPTVGTVSLSGSGATSATFGVSGQTITISNAAVTDVDDLQVTVTGLSTPVPVAGETGNYPFQVSTTASGGSLMPIANQPAAHVIAPIIGMRGINANGVAVEAGTVVAVEGVSTEQDFGNTGTSNFSAFIQDSTAGVNIFSSSEDPMLVRGNRFAIVGTVAQFNGLTEIVPLSASSVVALGADVEPAPVTVSLATLLENPEDYEGRLITVEALSYVSGTWGLGQTVKLEDSSSNRLDIRIQGGSSAATEPVYPASITGVLGQYDTSSPYNASYQLMPRDEADVVGGVSGGGYADWAALNGVTEGPDGDDDMDGIANLIEYALGLDPQVGNGSPGTFDGSTLSFTKSATERTDVTYTIETSSDLGVSDPWTPVTADTNDASTISYTLPTSGARLFARLVVTQN